MAEPSATVPPSEHKVGVGRGGHSIEASRNFWEGSGLKIDSASTDVVWGHGSKLFYILETRNHGSCASVYLVFNNKILTSARNGELIMWDLNKSGSSKYGAFPRPLQSESLSTQFYLYAAHLASPSERRARVHTRSIHALAYSSVVQYYCMTGSADGELRVWVSEDSSSTAKRNLTRCHEGHAN